MSNYYICFMKFNEIDKLWFCSDPHYNHKNICRGVSTWDSGTREFDNLSDMNLTIVDNINKSVGENDILFCLGDWSFGGRDSVNEFRDRINCKNIHLTLGNHDKHISYDSRLFKSVNHYLEIRAGNNNLVLGHYPISSWNGLRRGSIHLFGHCHLPSEHKIREGKSMDVGLDGNNMFPYSMTEIIDIMSNQPISSISIPKSVDHHQ